MCRSLPKNVERADFFRYMVILKHGGVYADIDTECRRPLRDVIQPHDNMVVGWENEFATLKIAKGRCAGLALLRLTCAAAACAECWWLFSALSHPMPSWVGSNNGAYGTEDLQTEAIFGSQGCGCRDPTHPCCSRPVHCEATVSRAELISFPIHAPLRL